ncbi:universal stress protein [Desulfogranum marinum]|uniref:universal stress protein n=1 Tax=Desulfogranum marinum TaxID=453220 RepID=UPI0019665681|nr:universal stress protein [Desulfogranum marinum]MBM9514487.1 universal stress protein [Desulfogranum marinum]
MQNITKIVVPVDLQQHTEKLTEFAINIAGKLDAAVSFIHVVKPLDSYSGVVHPSWDQIEKELKEHAQEKIDNLVTDNKAQCAGCSGKVSYGDAVDQILAYVEAEKASMIIIGTHGRKGLEKIMLGSVASEIAKQAPCPTLLFNPYK